VKTVQSPVNVPALTTKTVATLDIPKPGKYVVTAKAIVVSASGADITCGLGLPSGSAVDISRITLFNSGFDTLANQMALDYTAPGSAMLRCSANQDTQAHWISITATRVDNLTSS
jgi:hypothetical protein